MMPKQPRDQVTFVDKIWFGDSVSQLVSQLVFVWVYDKLKTIAQVLVMVVIVAITRCSLKQ